MLELTNFIRNYGFKTNIGIKTFFAYFCFFKKCILSIISNNTKTITIVVLEI